jgi:hypothetical protein
MVAQAWVYGGSVLGMWWLRLGIRLLRLGYMVTQAWVYGGSGCGGLGLVMW